MKLTTLALTLLLTLPVFAADSVVFLIERTQTELGEGIKIIEQTQHDVDKAKEQLKPLERIFDKNKTQHDAIRKQLEDDITLYNQTCEGRPVSYNHCGTRQNAMRLEKTRKEKGLLSRICGVILVPGGVPSCDKGRFPWHRRYESRRIVW